jgi:hypothetical protein
VTFAMPPGGRGSRVLIRGRTAGRSVRASRRHRRNRTRAPVLPQFSSTAARIISSLFSPKRGPHGFLTASE